MQSVVIVDDHPVLASCIASALSSQHIAYAHPVDPESSEAEKQMIDLAPDLCLLDLDLGHQQAAGMRFVRAATAAGLKVVMFTGSADEAALGRCIETGAIGVVRKTTTFSVVIDQLRQVLAGGPCNTDTELLRWVLAAQRHEAQQRTLNEPFARLSRREQVVLQHLIEGEHVDHIAAVEYVSASTVRSQVRSVLQKLRVQSQLAAVASARRSGWSYESLAVSEAAQ